MCVLRLSILIPMFVKAQERNFYLSAVGRESLLSLISWIRSGLCAEKFRFLTT
jgi:hypothetical protein